METFSDGAGTSCPSSTNTLKSKEKPREADQLACRRRNAAAKATCGRDSHVQVEFEK
jgi:hypothetical protein